MPALQRVPLPRKSTCQSSLARTGSRASTLRKLRRTVEARAIGKYPTSTYSTPYRHFPLALIYLLSYHFDLWANLSIRGGAGEEVVDQQFNFTNARRRSNSSGYSNNLRDFKTKFEFNEPEPVFEETLHGPQEDEEDDALAKTDTTSSSGSSVDEKDHKNF
jgi:hypothetical protein